MQQPKTFLQLDIAQTVGGAITHYTTEQGGDDPEGFHYANGLTVGALADVSIYINVKSLTAGTLTFHYQVQDLYGNWQTLASTTALANGQTAHLDIGPGKTVTADPGLVARISWDFSAAATAEIQLSGYGY